MAKLFNSEMSRTDILKRCGSMHQFCDMRPGTLADGKARDMRCIEVRTGGGLSFTILPDRCMDIAWADYNGIPLGYMTKSPVCGPQYFIESGSKGFLDNFFGGLLTTSGLSNTGSPNEDGGVSYGLHGTISNTPAENVCIHKAWDTDDYVMKASGIVRQARFYGENLELRRSISVQMGGRSVIIRDEIENIGFAPEPVMILYHFNFCWPFISENSTLKLMPSSVTPRTPEAEKGISSYADISAPVSGYKEQCFYHDFVPSEDGFVKASLDNPALGAGGLRLYLKYLKRQLPYFCQWKQTGEGEYVMGLIPANWYAEGRKAAREQDQLEILQPGQMKEIELEIGIEEL